jgi:hypothetical protein
VSLEWLASVNAVLKMPPEDLQSAVQKVLAVFGDVEITRLVEGNLAGEVVGILPTTEK